MVRELLRVISNPKKFIRIAAILAEQKIPSLFINYAYFMQGQMDINQKSRWHNKDFTKETGGYFIPNDQVKRTIVSLHSWDTVRKDMLILLLRTINERQIRGDLAELGVYRGFTAKLIHHYMPDRPLHLFDTFAGFDTRDILIEHKTTGIKETTRHFCDTNVDKVLKYIDMKNSNVKIYQGYFPDSAPKELGQRKFAFVHLDVDLYAPTMAGLEYFCRRISQGGFLVVHDYNAWPGVRRAMDEFFSDKVEKPIPMPDKSGSALIVKALV
jgi:O-methyltransferase